MSNLIYIIVFTVNCKCYPSSVQIIKKKYLLIKCLLPNNNYLLKCGWPWKWYRRTAMTPEVYKRCCRTTLPGQIWPINILTDCTVQGMSSSIDLVVMCKTCFLIVPLSSLGETIPTTQNSHVNKHRATKGICVKYDFLLSRSEFSELNDCLYMLYWPCVLNA